MSLHSTTRSLVALPFSLSIVQVKAFELPDAALPDCFLVVRIDGRGFHR
jgi:hypothetical protein